MTLTEYWECLNMTINMFDKDHFFAKVDIVRNKHTVTYVVSKYFIDTFSINTCRFVMLILKR